MPCDHAAPHSGGTRYLRDTRELEMLLVCDECGAERALLGRIDYFPNPRRLAGQLAELTARELGLGEARIERVRFAALVCDIGRDQIPPEILNKKGPLTAQEWLEVRRQPEIGAALLCDVSLEDIREWILCHRERPDGHGYPRGLVGEQIPLEARILAVTDAYMAMISERPHRRGRDHAEACLELARGSGSQFDAGITRAFLAAIARRSPQLVRAA